MAMNTNQKSTLKKADQYNDVSHNYLNYWNHRNYEHQSEVLAIKKLLGNNHYKLAVDIGGGYGRLTVLLENYADQVILAEPSSRQLEIADDFLKDHPGIVKKIMQADQLEFLNNSVDLITLIRVMHHLPDPMAELKEISRVLSPSGEAIIEMANYDHFLNRIKLFLKGKKLPTQPVDIRSEKNKTNDEIPFVNHNPKTVISQLNSAGLTVVNQLSVSNLRNTILKKFIPVKILLFFENIMQQPLAKYFFGPSIFLLVTKKDN